ncbi:MAG: protein translocase subunit SecF [Actinomycetota bacterium]
MTATPPETEDVPGVTRRHSFKDLYHERTNFQFIERSRRWAILSGTLLLIGLVALVGRGLNFNIDFEGGTVWLVEMAEGNDASVAEVRDLLDPLGFGDAKVATLTGGGDESVRVQAETIEDPVRELQDAVAEAGAVDDADVVFTRAGDTGTFEFTLPADATADEAKIKAALADAGQPEAAIAVEGQTVTVTISQLPTSPLQQVADALAEYAGVNTAEVSISTVGPTWGEQVTEKAIQALVLFFVLLAAYLSFRFEWKMAIASIIAVLHDIVITAGTYAVFQWDVSPATITAFLTILGFSLYDTVVVFDKIGENQRALTATGRSTYPEMVNKSLNAVLMRSLSTTIVALLPVMSLLIVGSMIMGAQALEEFALALAVGLLIGAYSSIFVAAPILAWWKNREPQYRALAERRRRTATAPPRGTLGTAATDDDDPRPAATVRTGADGIAGPPAVPRTTTPRPRQQRGRKRK